MSTIDFSKAREIPNFGLSGRTGKLKGDESDRKVLIIKDYSVTTKNEPQIDGIVGIMTFEVNGTFNVIQQIPLVCLDLDENK